MLEQIYNDLITNVLPLAQEGLMITKDYFQDLFGRYIQYLLIMDSISLGLSIITIILFIFFTKWTIKNLKNEDNDTQVGVSLFLIGIATILTIWFSCNLKNVTQDIYIPEIRVYEKIQSLNINN